MTVRQAPRRILIPILTGLGNCVMLTPLIETLRKEFPSAAILLFTNGRWNVQDLFKTHPGVETTFTIPKEIDLILSPRIASTLPFIAKAKAMNPSAQIIAHDFKRDERVRIVKNMSLRLMGASIVPLRLEHETLQNLSLLRPLAVQERAWILQPKIFPTSPVPQAGIIVQPGAANATPTPKRWPEAKWSVLITALLKAGEKVTMVGDSSEFALGERIAHESGSTLLVNLCGKTSIPELVNRVAGAKALIAGDSGIGHLAGALGIPVFTLWGPTSWTRSRPMGDKIVKISLELPCSPCTGEPGLPGEIDALARCPIQNRCMVELSVNSVLERVQS